MYLVTKSKPAYGNILAYDNKTKEYVYIHKGKEKWREKGDTECLDFFTEHRDELYKYNYSELLERFPIYKKYDLSCDKED